MAAVPAEYLINYGRSAFLGRFVNRAGISFARDERVVVQSARGLEAGVILQEVLSDFAHLIGVPSGDLLRRFADDDALREKDNFQSASNLIQEAQTTADSLGMPLTILDAEMSLDGQRIVLHLLPLAECDPTPLADLLSKRHNLTVSFLDPRHPAEPESKGCGKPGCGSASGSCSDCGSGCSSGSCSSGKVKSADEMTAYFVQLRQKMEREFGRVPLRV